MSKTVREVEVKFFLCYLDAVLDSNYILETIDVEDEVFPEQLQSKNLQGKFRLKSFQRSGNVIEKVYLKFS